MNYSIKMLTVAVLFLTVYSADAQFTEYGEAAYYADALHGKRTSTGELYDKNQLTGSHRSLPTGSIIKVTRTDNNKSVRVRINDCADHSKSTRIVDLSRAAAEKIDLVWDGVAPVRIELIQRGKGPSPCDAKAQPDAPVAYSNTGGTLTARGVAQATPSPYVLPPNGGTFPFELLRSINTGYGVQVASFNKFENATAKAEELRAKGFRDILINTSNFNYRVILGPFDTEDSAENYRKSLASRYKMKGFTVDLAGL